VDPAMAAEALDRLRAAGLEAAAIGEVLPAGGTRLVVAP